jgi:hypothetical protein
MGYREEVAALEFTATTRLDGEGIRGAGRRAVAAARSSAGRSVVQDDDGSSLRYRVLDPDGSTQMVLTVLWREIGRDHRFLRFAVADYVSCRSTFLFIPVSRRSVPALPAARRFAEALRAALGA